MNDNIIQNNLQTTLAMMTNAANQLPYTTPSVTLIAVSKHQTVANIQLAASAKQIHFGENYIQEGVDKIIYLKKDFPYLIWHMIGPIQSNKTRLVAEYFDWVHTIDRLKTAQRLSEQRPKQSSSINVLIQINIDSESSKSGVLAKDALALILAIAQLPHLQLRGLMCIPEKKSALAFERMATLYQELRKSLPSNIAESFDVLSMGMSQDFVSAIAYGATHIRVGTAIFGTRPTKY
jgi:PLP dependent protein